MCLLWAIAVPSLSSLLSTFFAIPLVIQRIFFLVSLFLPTFTWLLMNMWSTRISKPPLNQVILIVVWCSVDGQVHTRIKLSGCVAHIYRCWHTWILGREACVWSGSMCMGREACVWCSWRGHWHWKPTEAKQIILMGNVLVEVVIITAADFGGKMFLRH